ncbi:MAG: CotH kinase family protein [Crocinitomicaceae bacterium]|nr:CotH kinase family protein [Crocinitomicaceae bacterium]
MNKTIKLWQCFAMTVSSFFILGDVSAQLTSSELPIVIISTGASTFSDATIPDEPKINATMSIIDNGPGVMNNLTDTPTGFVGNIGIETRGNSTQGFSKKTYSLETKSLFFVDSSVAILGMGADEDWILHSMVIDKTQLRIPMTFDLARAMGHYASNWRYVELVVDNDYRGLYLMCEKLKRDDDRVDIANLAFTDIAGDQLTGGYILRMDWLDDPQGFESNYYSLSGDPMFFQYYYPKAINIHPAQEAYIAGYMSSFEDALYGTDFTNSQGIHYSQYADITTFVDFLITNEISKNSDGYKLSSYVHKNRQSMGGHLKAGPIWDFDQTYGMSTVCSCDDYLGWTYMQNQPECEDFESMPMWWSTMMTDTIFTNHLACRWNELRTGPLHLDSIFNWIDTYNNDLSNATTRNFQKWTGFIGQQIWAEPNPIPATYADEIIAMKDWITNRFAWLDANITGNCQFDVAVIENIDEIHVKAFPNPSSTILNIEAPVNSKIALYDLSGKILLNDQMTSSIKQLDVTQFTQGVYILSVTSNNYRVQRKVVIN